MFKSSSSRRICAREILPPVQAPSVEYPLVWVGAGKMGIILVNYIDNFILYVPLA